MHLIVIIAFAALLWFNTDRPINKLQLSAGVSGGIVLVQILLLAAAATWTTRKTLKELAQNPTDPNEAQYSHHYYSMILQMIMVGLFVANLILTGWPVLVRNLFSARLTFGLAELLVLAPFVITMIAVWIVQYPADRAIRELALNPRLERGHPVHPVWSLWQYLSFNIRYQLLTIAVPMTLIIVGDDVIDNYRPRIMQATGGLIWVSDALMGILVCGVFLLAPVMLRFIWHTQSLPEGELRGNLERIAETLKLSYRDILLWQSRGMVVNAAVMGIVPSFRYILISDGLLESMSDKQIEAVFGHEAGHINCWHIPYFIVFATLTMLVAGGLVEVLRLVSGSLKWLTFDYIQIIVGLAVVGIWGIAFGWLSHRFEHQADLSGAESITPEADQCSRPCLVHGQATGNPAAGLCATAADEFSKALHRVAALNGIPTEEKGWRHPSIDTRIAFLTGASAEASTLEKFNRSVRQVKLFLLIATAIGLVAGGWLYRQQLLPPSWLN